MFKILQKILFIILVVILMFMTIPNLISYGIELWEYIQVEVYGWSGNYRIILNYEWKLQVIPTLVLLVATLIVLGIKKIPLFVKNIIIASFIGALIVFSYVWNTSYHKAPWLYNSRISHNGLGEYIQLDAN